MSFTHYVWPFAALVVTAVMHRQALERPRPAPLMPPLPAVVDRFGDPIALPPSVRVAIVRAADTRDGLLTLRSTLSPVTQDLAAAVAAEAPNQAHVIVIDHQTDEILAWAAPAHAASPLNVRLTEALDPLYYGISLDHGFSPLSLIPIDQAHSYPMRRLLRSRPDLVRDHLVKIFGAEFLEWQAREFGLARADRSDLREVSSAYAALARGGRWREVRILPATKAGYYERQVLKPAAAALVTRAFSDFADPHPNRALAAGTAGDDSFAFAYDIRYLVTVWLDRMWDRSALADAGPMALKLLRRLTPDSELEELPIARHVRPARVCQSGRYIRGEGRDCRGWIEYLPRQAVTSDSGPSRRPNPVQSWSTPNP